MSLFDDDFYSTRISRRARDKKREEQRSAPGGMRKPRPLRSRNQNWSTIRLVTVTSMSSAIVAVLLFGAITGFDRGGGLMGNSSVAAVAPVASTDDSIELRTIQAADKVRPAVVSIINEQRLPRVKNRKSTPNESNGDKEAELIQAAVGSGFIFEKVKGKAHIITNAHVVQDAESLKAVLSNGEMREAKLIGADPITDLAVIEMDAKGIDTIAEIGDSKTLRAGQWVMAIGNPLGLSDSLTLGIVSKTQRVIPVSLSQDGVYDWEQEVIQVDASINQGNSGGPLIDLNGKVVGINSMKVADFGVEGVGFAIPSNFALPIIDSLLEYGKVKRPYLGVYTMDLRHFLAQSGATPSGPSGFYGEDDEDFTDEDAGGDLDPGATGEEDDADTAANEDSGSNELKLPAAVKDGVVVLEAVGPSSKAGLKYSDVIVKLDKQPITSTMDLRKYLYEKKAIGDDITVTYYRKGEKMTVTFTLDEKSNSE